MLFGDRAGIAREKARNIPVERARARNAARFIGQVMTELIQAQGAIEPLMAKVIKKPVPRRGLVLVAH